MTQVRDVMATDVVTVAPDASIRQMARLMRSRRVGALLVVDPEGDRLVGIVTEADLMAKLAYGASPAGDLALLWEESVGWGSEWVMRALGMTARELMASPVVQTSPEASMAEAARTMLQKGLKHLPVVSEGRVVGLLSRSDLLEPFERSDAQLRGEVATRLVAFLPEGADAPGVEVLDGVVVVAADGLNPRERTELEVHLAELPGVAGVRMSARRR